MTHTELTYIAERWLRNNQNCGIVFRELNVLQGEIPDAIGFQLSHSILIECKVSRADFLGDKNKPFRIDPSKGMGNFRFYMCPDGLIDECELPDKWGLLYVKGKRVKVVKDVTKARPWTNEEIVSGEYQKMTWKARQENRFEADERSEWQMMYSALRRVYLRGDLEKIYDASTIPG